MPAPQTFQSLADQGHAFCVFPDARIFDKPDGKSIQHLLFGDYITPPKKEDGKYRKWTTSLLQQVNDTWWINVRSRQEEGWMKLNDVQEARILEVNFVDIGQGDGCHLVTPDDCHFIIDAGKRDNMYRFLRWRYNLNKPGKKLPKFYGLISHCDDDHWKGFEHLLSKIPAGQQRQIKFEKLYHQGILQRSGSTLGNVVKKDGQFFLQDFIQTGSELVTLLRQQGDKSMYEKLLIGALKNFPDLPMETVWKSLKKKTILHKDKQLTLEVIAPVPEAIDGKLCLRWFDRRADEISKTKNGHSIVLMAHIGKMKIMLGGDLNSMAADYLMEKYSGSNVRELRKNILEADGDQKKELQEQMDKVIEKCRAVFQSEVAKSCHHGSHDITNEFLKAMNPIATVISSGDEESYCHPRPETLGAIGKYSRGERPLIFSTELARSSPEYIELENKESKTDKIKQRIVSTYGMITLRTDGEKAIISQKLESVRYQFGDLVKWHIDKLVWNDKRGEFVTLE
jgi:beta-lactamase superfamily II metal-dependent hydrolase